MVMNRERTFCLCSYSEFVTRELSNDSHHACGCMSGAVFTQGWTVRERPCLITQKLCVGWLHASTTGASVGSCGAGICVLTAGAPGSVWRPRSLELSTVLLHMQTTIHRLSHEIALLPLRPLHFTRKKVYLVYIFIYEWSNIAMQISYFMAEIKSYLKISKDLTKINFIVK